MAEYLCLGGPLGGQRREIAGEPRVYRWERSKDQPAQPVAPKRKGRGAHPKVAPPVNEAVYLPRVAVIGNDERIVVYVDAALPDYEADEIASRVLGNHAGGGRANRAWLERSLDLEGQIDRSNQVMTEDRGLVPLGDIMVGEKVLTHKGRFRTVVRTFDLPPATPTHRVVTRGGRALIVPANKLALAARDRLFMRVFEATPQPIERCMGVVTVAWPFEVMHNKTVRDIDAAALAGAALRVLRDDHHAQSGENAFLRELGVPGPSVVALEDGWWVQEQIKEMRARLVEPNGIDAEKLRLALTDGRPDEVMTLFSNASVEVIEQFLGGLYIGINVNILVAMVPELAILAHRLLSIIGIKSEIAAGNARGPANNCIAWSVRLDGKPEMWHAQNRLPLDELRPKIPFLPYPDRDPRHKRMMDQVCSVDTIDPYDAPVFDLEVDEDHSYTISDVAVFDHTMAAPDNGEDHG